jgi:predicted enzyme related to lactoylglutathione lyase
MIAMPRVVHFECHADDPERTAAFYREVFGWNIVRTRDPHYLRLSSGAPGEPGIDGAVMPRIGGSSFTNAIEVSSIHDFGLRVIRAGGEVLMAERTVPGLGRIAYCSDAEGNVFGLLEREADG